MKKFLEKLARSPWWPPILSAFVVPGTGQIYNREMKKGFALAALSVGTFLWFTKVVVQQLALVIPTAPEQWQQDPTLLRDAMTKVVDKNPDMFLTFYLLMFVVWTFSVVDAYVVARNLRRPPSTPPADENTHLNG